MRSFQAMVAVAILVMAGVSGLYAQQSNSPESSLWFNRNTGTQFPLHAMAGEIDPNLIVVQGTPGETYRVQIGNYGPSIDRYPFLSVWGSGAWQIDQNNVLASYSGTLDGAGQASIIIPPGTLLDGTSLAIQARVGRIYSGVTKFDVVWSMSAPPDLAMAAGSVANILGPITSINTNAIFVGNLEYQLTVDTIFGNEPLKNLEVGDWVDMVGEFNATGGLNAVEVNAEDPEDEVRIRARVQGIGPSGFCLLNVSVFVSNATVLVDYKTGAFLTFADIELAMPVEIRIPISPEGFPWVSSGELNVEIEPEDEPENEKENEDPPPFCS